MNAAKRGVHRLRGFLRRQRREFFTQLDAEGIAGFQAFYYPTIMLAGCYLWLAADAPTQALAETIGEYTYWGWLWLNIACPALALYGRRVYRLAGELEVSKARFGAALQLVGDGGVWAAICVYFACVVNTTYWGAALYPTFFFMMGVPGGLMFTWRSWRRWRQVVQ